jgi:ABC-2 type transport system ATP-binding protein
MIRAENLSYWYGRVLALSGLTLSIEPGLTGLLGPNGSGKTTFLRLIMGLLRPTSGRLTVMGDNPWNQPGLCRLLGYAPESEMPRETMSGKDYVRLALRLKGSSPAHAAELAARALERVGATEFARRSIRTLSHGMRQRVKIAAALAHEPRLLVLDEPLTGSDPVVRAQIIELIRGIAAEQRTVIVSSHVLHEIEALTDRIVLLNRGRLVAHGKIAEIRSLIDRHPHQVRVCGPRLRELAAALASEPCVREIAFPDGVLTVRTADPARFYALLTRLIAERGISVEEVSSLDDNLEAVFRYLTES